MLAPYRQRRLLLALLAAPHFAAPFTHPLGIQIAAGLMDILPQLAALFRRHALAVGGCAVGGNLRRTRVRHHALRPGPVALAHRPSHALGRYLSNR